MKEPAPIAGRGRGLRGHGSMFYKNVLYIISTTANLIKTDTHTINDDL